MLAAIALAGALIAATVFFHYEGLRLLHTATQSVRFSRARSNTLLVIFTVMGLLLIEIGAYGIAYWFGDIILNIGDFAGRAVTMRDYMYFSAESFTTLGLGDIYPVGDLRLIASIESLNGLLLLGWSGSFTYITMRKHWDSAP